MLSALFQYFYILKEIRIAKRQGYESMCFRLIYPVNQEKLKKKGYQVRDNISLINFKKEYVVCWR